MPSSEPLWLPVEAAIAYNQHETGKTGEPHLVLSYHLLESAVWRPRHIWAYEHQTNILILGAALLGGIARAHAFQQGNKRTAFVSMVAFIEENGYRFTAPDNGDAAWLVRQLVTGAASEKDVAYRLQEWAKMLELPGEDKFGG